VDHSTYLENPFVSKDFIDEADDLKAKKPLKYRWEMLGEAIGNGVVPFDNLTFRTISDEEISQFDNIRQGIDWGYANDPLSFGRWHYDKKKRTIYALDELYGVKISNRELAEWLKKNGYHTEYNYWYPMKRLAVRSGLAEYGKNNITYIDDWGSFYGLSVFISDAPFDEYSWRPVKNMDICNDCNICLNNCPTGAILSDRFLIDNEKCISRYNENGTEPFPEWIPKTAHRSLVDCLYCQKFCPKNNKLFENITDTVEFSENETVLLSAGEKKENLPRELIDKIDNYNLNWFYSSIPRNLKAMLDNAR
jgi:ferredoxin